MISHLIISLLAVTSPSLPEAKKTAVAAKAVKNTTQPTRTGSTTPATVSKEAESVVAQAFAEQQTPTPATQAAPVPSSVEQSSVWLPIVALAGLAIAAFLLSRKKQQTSGMIRILETTSLGPRRSLIIAQIQGKTLLMAASEAGVSVLSSELQAPIQSTAPEQTLQPLQPAPAIDLSSPIRAALGALFPSRAQTPSFEQTLQEVTQMPSSGEDEDLRAKLAAGLRGRKS